MGARTVHLILLYHPRLQAANTTRAWGRFCQIKKPIPPRGGRFPANITLTMCLQLIRQVCRCFNSSDVHDWCRILEQVSTHCILVPEHAMSKILLKLLTIVLFCIIIKLTVVIFLQISHHFFPRVGPTCGARRNTNRFPTIDAIIQSHLKKKKDKRESSNHECIWWTN